MIYNSQHEINIQELTMVFIDLENRLCKVHLSTPYAHPTPIIHCTTTATINTKKYRETVTSKDPKERDS